MIPQLLLALASPPALPTEVQTDGFGITIDSLHNSKQGVRVGMKIDNQADAGKLFIHLEPNVNDASMVLFVPPVKPIKDPFTYYFKNARAHMKATLMFPFDAIATTSVLVVGENEAPYHQAALALDLTRSFDQKKVEQPTLVPSASPSVAPSLSAIGSEPVPFDERVIQRYHPPFAALGGTIVLKNGSGPEGHGWIRIYSDLPDVTLNQLKKSIEHPQQIWAGSGRLLFIVKLSATRAIAVDVANNEVRTAHYIDKASFQRLVGPGTLYPNRIYVGR